MNRRGFLRKVGYAGMALAGAGCVSTGSSGHSSSNGAGIGDGGSDPSAPPPTPSAGARGMALTIGLNGVDPAFYSGWDGPLSACEWDAQDMADIARENRFEVKTLKTSAATRGAVHDEIVRAAETLHDGDIFLVSYSGHGGQVADDTADEEDGLDETWCLFDGELLDDELSALWSRFQRGVRILVFSDSCHSGSVTKKREYEGAAPAPGPTPAAASQEMRFRFLPSDVAKLVNDKHREFYKKIQNDVRKAARAPVEASVILISGCQDNQLSLDGDRNGLFTQMVRRVYSSGSPGDYVHFHSSIVRLMPANQTPNYFITGRPNSNFERQRVFTV